MNNGFLGSIVFTIGVKLFKKSNSITVIQGPDSDRRKAIVGIITAGAGIYIIGRSDGYQQGYDRGAIEAIEVLLSMDDLAKKI